MKKLWYALCLCFALGHAQQFGLNKVQYEPYRWQKIQTTHFDIYFYQGGELMHIYENILKSYTINYTKLFSYAKRRDKEQEIKQFLNNNMYHLVKDIIE